MLYITQGHTQRERESVSYDKQECCKSESQIDRMMVLNILKKAKHQNELSK